MTRCVVLDDYQHVALQYGDWTQLSDLDVEVVHDHVEGDELLALLQGAQVVVAMRERTAFPASLLSQLPDLELLVTTGMRNASIDLSAAAAGGVVVSGTPGTGNAHVELTWGLIHAVTRHLLTEAMGVRTGAPWQQTVGVGLHGKTIGLVGLGNSGTAVARVAQAFGMRVTAWSPHLTAERTAAAGVELLSLDELMATSDIVSVHLVLSESTRHILDANALDHLEPRAFLINTSRAGLVDTTALVERLRDGRIAGAGLDVYDAEPLAADDPLRSLPHVVATPHIGYVTDENYAVFFQGITDAISAWQAGEPIRVLAEPV